MLKVVIAEHIRKRRIHAFLVGYFRVVGTTLIDDLQGDTITYRLPHGVLVDVLTEDALGLVNRRAGITDLCSVRDGPIEIRSELLVLGTMGFIGHDQDVGAVIKLWEGLVQVFFLELVDHGHDQVRGVGPEQFLQFADPIGRLHREADTLAGLAQLVFELCPVGDEDHFPVRQLRVAVHFTHHEHHGERFARALGVPDDAAPFARVGALQQSLHGQLDRAKLLVASHNLDGLPSVVGRKQSERADEIKQVALVHHPGDQPLLVVWAACAMIEVVDRSRMGVGPAVEMLFTMRGDRPELGLLATGGDHKLIEIKERRTSFACDTTLLAVAQHLVDGLGDGVLHLGRLAFNQDHGQAIHEQHSVRDDVVLGAQDTDLALAHGNKAIVGAILEVDKAYGRAILARLPVLVDAGVLQKEAKDVLVVLD